MQAAQVAAKAVDQDCPVEVIDSLQVSMALGSLCLTAAQRADAGADLGSIAAEVLERRNRTRLFGTLDTLEYLRKGGRVGAAQALLGSMLSIKPVLTVSDGVVAEAGKVRTRSKALRHVVEKLQPGQFENVCVLHGDAPDLEEFLDLLAPIVPRDEIVVGQIGPVIGTHAGPRTIGITYQVPR
jgi:DegV family protein with EDD domain